MSELRTCPFHPHDVPSISEIPASEEQKRWWGVDTVWVIECKWMGCFLSRTSGSAGKEDLIKFWNNRNQGFKENLRLV